MEVVEKQPPKILRMKIWHINEKPAFYGYEENPTVYSVLDKCEVPKPSILGLMGSRDVMPEDLSQVILHNQLDDEDFAALAERKLLAPELEVLYTKIKELKVDLENLRGMMGMVQKSDEEQPTPIADPTSSMIDAVIQAVKAGMMGGSVGSSVFSNIVAGTHGLSEQDKKVIELIGKHFNLQSSV
jgi:hypothetical protein